MAEEQSELVRVMAYGPDGIGQPVERFWLDGRPIELHRDVEVDPDLLIKRSPEQFREMQFKKMDGLPPHAQVVLRSFTEETITEGYVSDEEDDDG